MPGIDGLRWGSLASSGLPVAVREPLTTHEFDPTPSPSAPSRPDSDCTAPPSAPSTGCASRRIRLSALYEAGAALGPATPALASKTPLRTAPPVMIGWLRSNG